MKLVPQSPFKLLVGQICGRVAVWAFGLLIVATSIPVAKAGQLNCSLLFDGLESNLTLSLKTAETLSTEIGSGALPDGTLVGEAGPQFLTNYIELTTLVSARISLVIDDLNAMNQIGADCIEAGHFKAVIGQARSADNIDQYLNEKFTSAKSETSVFLSIATAPTLLGARSIRRRTS